MTALPQWPDGTVGILATGGEAPHAIPVSALVRLSDDALVIGLGTRRGSLERLRADPRCALALLAAGDVAVTAHCRATILDPLSERVVAVRLEVESIQDHNRDDFVIDDGVVWRWTDDASAARDAAIRDALRRLK